MANAYAAHMAHGPPVRSLAGASLRSAPLAALFRPTPHSTAPAPHASSASLRPVIKGRDSSEGPAVPLAAGATRRRKPGFGRPARTVASRLYNARTGRATAVVIYKRPVPPLVA